jgi:hypothetical protein
MVCISGLTEWGSTLTCKALTRVDAEMKTISKSYFAAFYSDIISVVSPAVYHVFGVVTVDGVWIGEWILATCIHHSKLHFTSHRHTDWCPQSITVSTSHFLATASIEGDSSASRTQVLLSQPPEQNSCQLTTQPSGCQAGGHFTPTS